MEKVLNKNHSFNCYTFLQPFFKEGYHRLRQPCTDLFVTEIGSHKTVWTVAGAWQTQSHIRKAADNGRAAGLLSHRSPLHSLPQRTAGTKLCQRRQKELHSPMSLLASAGRELGKLRALQPAFTQLPRTGNIRENHRVQQSNFWVTPKISTTGRQKVRVWFSPPS